MTRDGELPARQFIDTSLAALATEHESTTFRYALAQVSTTAWHYTAPAERAETVKHVAAELFKLAGQAKAGSDEQFQLVTAYLATASRATRRSSPTRRACSTVPWHSTVWKSTTTSAGPSSTR